MISSKVMTETLLNDTYSIHHGSLTNTDQIKEYTGGRLPTMFVDGREVLTTFGAIYGAQRKTWADANLTGNIDADSTRQIIECVCATIEHSIPETMAAIESKRAEFAAAGLNKVVKNSLELMLYHHKTNASVLKDKFSRHDEQLLKDFQQEAVEVTEMMERILGLFSDEDTLRASKRVSRNRLSQVLDSWKHSIRGGNRIV